MLDIKRGDTINSNFELSSDIQTNMSNYVHWYGSLYDSLDFLIRSTEGEWNTVERAQESCSDSYRNCKEMCRQNWVYLSEIATKYNIENDADLVKAMK